MFYAWHGRSGGFFDRRVRILIEGLVYGHSGEAEVGPGTGCPGTCIDTRACIVMKSVYTNEVTM